MFFFQYLVQAGFFFVVPLFLSVCLGLSALATGCTAPAALDHAARRRDRHPASLPNVSPRLVVRGGLLALLAGTVVLLGAARHGRRPGDRLRPDAADRARDRRARLAARRRHGLRRARRREPRGRRRPEHDDQPRRLAGHGARRLDPDRHPHVRLLDEHRSRARRSLPASSQQAQVQLAGGVPFISDADLEAALDEARVSSRAAERRSTRTRRRASPVSAPRSRSSRCSRSSRSSSRSAFRLGNQARLSRDTSVRYEHFKDDQDETETKVDRDGDGRARGAEALDAGIPQALHAECRDADTECQPEGRSAGE